MAEWPLIGRESELAHLSALLEEPQGPGVVLAGPAGVGKSRLGEEILRLARARGMATERICATFAASTLPLGAVLLSRPVQEAVGGSSVDQTELVHRMANELLRCADGRRLVLMVDDVQWLDQLSSVLVHQLVTMRSVFVVLTARVGMSAPDPILSLWKDHLVERVTVRALTRDRIEPLLSNALGGPVAGPAIAHFADSSEGNLLFLREQIQSALETGQLTRDTGIWQLTGRPQAQPRLIELVEHRLAGLDSAARQCLEVIAFGEPLELAEALSFARDSLLEDLETRDLLAVRADGWGGGTVWLAHPLIGEVLRAGTSVIRARQITEALATAAEARAPTQPDEILRIATWRLVCGGGSADLMYHAARAAYGRHDHELTCRLAAAAVAGGAGLRAKLLLAEASGMTGRRSEAESALAALAEEATSSGELAAVARARMVNAHLAGDAALGLRVYRDARIAIQEPSWRDELAATRSWLVIHQEGPRGVLTATDEVWSETLAGSPLVAASILRAAALARSGRVAEAFAVAARGRAAQAGMSEPLDLHESVHAMGECEALATAGRLEEWADLARRCYEQAVTERSATMQLTFRCQGARAALWRGQIASAIRLAAETVGLAHQLNDRQFLIMTLPILVEAQAQAGHAEDAARALVEFDALHPPSWNFSGAGMARAWLAVARGDLRTAQREFESEAELALGWDDRQLAMRALHGLVRIGLPKAALAGLSTLTGQVEGNLVQVLARHARAAASRDGAELRAVATDFQGLGALLFAAEAYCDAAVVVRAAGEPKRALQLVHQAGPLLDACEHARTPACQPVEVRAELTATERTTAMLAAQGWSNREIADAEHISVRTVESRLQGVYTKLGISSRRALAEHLGLLGDAAPADPYIGTPSAR